MTATILASAGAAVTTVATVVAASSPDLQALLSPLFDGGEYSLTAGALLIALPGIAVLTLIAGSAEH